MVEIYVDGDACPVKQEVIRVATRHRLTVHMVANRWMPSTDGPLVNRVIVEEGPDVADDWIAERCRAGDIVITADIPLADRCLKQGASVLGHAGKPFTPDNIGMALASRDLMAHLRDTGEISGGGRAFGKQDRSRFLQALERAIQANRRQT